MKKLLTNLQDLSDYTQAAPANLKINKLCLFDLEWITLVTKIEPSDNNYKSHRGKRPM